MTIIGISTKYVESRFPHYILSFKFDDGQNLLKHISIFDMFNDEIDFIVRDRYGKAIFWASLKVFSNSIWCFPFPLTMKRRQLKRIKHVDVWSKDGRVMY